MTVSKLKYILLTLAPLSAMLMTGCLDEPLVETDRFDNPDVISFTAVTGSGAASTRAGEEKQLYEPLVLTDDEASQTLYLHTYDSERIGFEPGDDVQSAQQDGAHTRGNQIETAEDLIKFHKDFMVNACFRDLGNEYIEWSKTQVSSANNFWRTEKTRYWPGERELSFMAVSPTAEFNSLNNKIFSDLRAAFSYTAKKQGNNRDAEAQTDLLLAAGTCKKSSSVDGRAPLKFHHALSAIKFAVRDVLDGEVVNVQIAGVHSSGNCEYFAESNGEGRFEWSDQTGSETYSQNFNYAINGRPSGGIDPGDDSQDILLNDAMPEKTFMLIPRRIPVAGMPRPTTCRNGFPATNTSTPSPPPKTTGCMCSMHAAIRPTAITISMSIAPMPRNSTPIKTRHITVFRATATAPTIRLLWKHVPGMQATTVRYPIM